MKMTNNCRKFQSNIFNKTRCQNCFKSKEEHSAEALEYSRTAKKVCLCGHLFVAPEIFDFSNPIDRTKRWQRRFFVLYDDGQLTYSVDENVGTIPQGEIDMNVCSELFDAQQITGHQFSLGIAVHSNVSYIKGTAKDEILRWQKMLTTFTHRHEPVKTTRNFILPPPPVAPPTSSLPPPPPPSSSSMDEVMVTEKLKISYDEKDDDEEDEEIDDEDDEENDDDDDETTPPLSLQDIMDSCEDPTVLKSPPDKISLASSSPAQTSTPRKNPVMENITNVPCEKTSPPERSRPLVPAVEKAAPLAYRGVRSLKHKNDRAYQDGLKKASSLQNLTANSAVGEKYAEVRATLRSQSGDRSSQRDSVSSGQQPSSVSKYVGESHASDAISTNTNTACYPSKKSLFASLSVGAQTNGVYDPLLAQLPAMQTGDEVTSYTRSRPLSRRKSATCLELERVSSTNIVSNTARLWEERSTQECLENTPLPVYGNISRSRTTSASATGSAFSSTHSSRVASPSPSTSVKSLDGACRRRRYDLVASLASNAVTGGGSEMTSPTDRYKNETDELKTIKAVLRTPSTPPIPRQPADPSAPDRPGTVAPTSSEDGRGTADNQSEQKFSLVIKQMAKSTDLNNSAMKMSSSCSESNSSFQKKGWLLRQTADKAWPKCWCVLTGRTITCYPDTKSEGTTNVEQIISLTSTANLQELDQSRNFAFIINVDGQEHLMSAMTLNLRKSWIESISQSINSLKPSLSSDTTDSIRQDSSRLRLLCVTATAQNSVTHNGTVQHGTAQNGIGSPNRSNSSSYAPDTAIPTGYTWPFRSPVPKPPPLFVDASSPNASSSNVSSSNAQSTRTSRVGSPLTLDPFRLGESSPSPKKIVTDNVGVSKAADERSKTQNVFRPGVIIDRRRHVTDLGLLGNCAPRVVHATVLPRTLGGEARRGSRGDNEEGVVTRRRRHRDVSDDLETDETSSTTSSNFASFEDLGTAVVHHHAPLQSPTHRAPSSRIRERTLNKSPKRVKSPPLMNNDDIEVFSESSNREFEQIAVDNSLIEMLESQIEGVNVKLAEALKASAAKSDMIQNLTEKLSRVTERQDDVDDTAQRRELQLEINRLRMLSQDGRQKIEELEKTVERHKQDNRLLDSQLQKSTQEIVILNAELEKMSARLKSKAETIARLQRELAEPVRTFDVDNLQIRVKELETQIETMEQSWQERVRNAENQRETAEKDLDECRQKLDQVTTELRAEVTDNDRLMSESSAHIAEIARLAQDLQSKRDCVGELEADIKHLREEQKSTSRVVMEKTTEMMLVQTDLGQVERRLTSVTDENAALKLKLSELENWRSTEKVAVSDSSQFKIIELDQKLAECGSANTQLVTENSRLSSEITELRKRFDDLSAVLEDFQHEADARLRERDSHSAELQCEVDRLANNCEVLKVARDKVSGERDAAGAELEELKKNSSAQLEQKCAELSAIQSIVGDLRWELETKERSLQETMAAIASGRTTPTPATLADLDPDSRSSPIGRDSGTESDLRDKYMFAVRQLKRLQAEVKQITARRDEFDQVCTDMRVESRKKDVAHEAHIAQLTDKINELMTKISALERRNLRLSRSSSEEKSGEPNISDNNNGCNLVKKLESELNASREENVVLSEELVKLTDAKLQIHNLSTQRDSLAARYDELLAEYSAHKDRYAQTGKENVLDVEELRNNLDDLKSELSRRDTACQQEIQALRDGYEIRIRSLQRDLAATRADLARSCVEREEDVAMYEKRLEAISAELKNEKLARRDADMNLREARGGVGKEPGGKEQGLDLTDGQAVAEEMEAKGLEELLRRNVEELKEQLEKERQEHEMVIRQLRGGSIDLALADQLDARSRVKQLEEQLHNLQADYEQELAMQKNAHRRELVDSREDIMQLLATAEANSIPIDEESIRKKYLKEIERIKDIYDRGFSTMEKSHQRTMMEMRKNHKQELDRVRHEKDVLLQEEAQATQSALDAMRKAHESELQKERNKFLDLIAKTYSHADIESLQRQHEDDIQLVQYEIRQLSEQYSVKCLENAAISERLDAQTRALHESRKRVQDLLVRNDELNTRLKYDIERLQRLALKQCVAVDGTDSTLDNNKLQLAVQVKNAEVAQLQEELAALRYNLNIKIEELKECNEKYHELLAEYQSNLHSAENSMDGIPKPRRSFEASDFRAERLSREDQGSASSQDDLIRSSSSSESSLSKFDDVSGSLLTSVVDQLQPADGVSEMALPKRSLWRFRNPQRARSNPTAGSLEGSSRKSTQCKSISGHSFCADLHAVLALQAIRKEVPAPV